MCVLVIHKYVHMRHVYVCILYRCTYIAADVYYKLLNKSKHIHPTSSIRIIVVWVFIDLVVKWFIRYCSPQPTCSDCVLPLLGQCRWLWLAKSNNSGQNTGRNKRVYVYVNIGRSTIDKPIDETAIWSEFQCISVVYLLSPIDSA